MNKTIYICSSLLCIIVSGCISLRKLEPLPTISTPAYYSEDLRDTNSMAKLNWKTFYSDSILITLIEEALEHNQDLHRAYQRIEIAKANQLQATGALFPMINAGTSSGVRKFGLYTMDGAGNIVTEITPGKLVPIHLPDFALGINTSWEADIWGKLRNKKKSAVQSFFASVEGVHLITSILVAEIATAYYELAALDSELEIIRQTMEKQTEALNVVVLQKEAGKATELAVLQFEAMLMHTRALEHETLQSIVEVENKISFLLGRYPGRINRSRNALKYGLPNEILTGIPVQMILLRPDIREAEKNLQAANFDVLAARAAFFPSLHFQAGIGYQAFDPTLLFATPASLAWHAIGGLTAPLFNQQLLKAQLNFSNAQRKSHFYRYQETVLNAFREVNNEINNLQNLKSIEKYRNIQNQVLLQSIETSNELLSTARAGYLEVLLAQQNALQAQLELIHVFKRQQIAKVNLYKALGGGW